MDKKITLKSEIMVDNYLQSEGIGSASQVSSEQWIEMRKENKREYSKQYRIAHPEYSYKWCLRQNPEKFWNSIYEWKRKTIIYPAPPGQRGLINLGQYKKSYR